MSPFLNVILLFLGSYVDPVAQARVLLENIPNLYMEVDAPIAFDSSGSLWIAAIKKDGIHVTRVDRMGSVVLEKLIREYDPIQDQILGFFNTTMVCDRWNNAYFMYGSIRECSEHLVRVTPHGNVEDYSPWPGIYSLNGDYIGIIPSDTLILVGRKYLPDVSLWKRQIRVARAVLGPEGLTTLSTTDYDPKSLYAGLLRCNPGMINWKEGWGYGAGVEDSKLSLAHFGITNPNVKLSFQELPFNDYIWRTYDDTRLPAEGLTAYKDSGYILWVPDPATRSSVHAVRIDSEGNPVLSSQLRDGGSKSSRNFKNLPSDAEPHASFRVYQHGSGLDSAQVIFWGADSDGNMYNYYDVKRYR